MPRSKKPRKRHNVHKTSALDLHRPPHMFQAYQTFSPIFDLLREVRSGEIHVVEGLPVMRIWGGDYCEVGTPIEGWISCWDRIISGEHLVIDLDPLREMHRLLMAGEMLTEELIGAVERVTDQCYRAYQVMPRELAISYSTTEMIAVAVDELGLTDTTDGREAA